MEDGAQQPQECLGRHLHGYLLSVIQNDFIWMGNGEGDGLFHLHHSSDFTDRIRSSLSLAEDLGFRLVIPLDRHSDRQGMVKESRKTFPHTLFTVKCCSVLHFPHVFSLTFLCVVCLLGHGLFPCSFFSFSATPTFKFKAFLTLHDSL